MLRAGNAEPATGCDGEVTITLERTFTILAFVLLIGAAVAVWKGRADAAFVLGTLAAVTWFVALRFRFKQRRDETEATERGDDASDENYEDED